MNMENIEYIKSFFQLFQLFGVVSEFNVDNTQALGSIAMENKKRLLNFLASISMRDPSCLTNFKLDVNTYLMVIRDSTTSQDQDQLRRAGFDIVVGINNSKCEVLWVDSIILTECLMILKKPLGRQLTFEEVKEILKFVDEFSPITNPQLEFFSLINPQIISNFIDLMSLI